MKASGFGERGRDGGGAERICVCRGIGSIWRNCRDVPIILIADRVVDGRFIFVRRNILSRGTLECLGSAAQGRGVNDGLLILGRNAFGKSGFLVLALVNKDITPVPLGLLNTCRQAWVSWRQSK